MGTVLAPSDTNFDFQPEPLHIWDSDLPLQTNRLIVMISYIPFSTNILDFYIMKNTICLPEIIVLSFAHLKRNLRVLTEVYDGAKKQFTY